MENENFVYVAIPLDSVIASGITSDATVQVSAADGVIVIEEDFYTVQKLLADNSINKSKNAEYPLKGKIKCECGKTYKPLTVNGKRYWECPSHNLDSSKCSSRRIPEKDICEAFITMVNKLRNNYKQMLPTAIAQIERLQMKSSKAALRIKEIDREIAELNGKHLVIARLNTKGIMRAAEYTEQSSKITSKTNTRCRNYCSAATAALPTVG